MPKDHVCAHPRCTVELPGYLLACRPHWMSLPLFLRAAINKAWSRRRRRPEDPEAVGAHTELVAGAVRYWIVS